MPKIKHTQFVPGHTQPAFGVEELQRILPRESLETLRGFLIEIQGLSAIQADPIVRGILEKYRRIDRDQEQLRDSAAVADVKKAAEALVHSLNYMNPEDRILIGLSAQKTEVLAAVLEDLQIGCVEALEAQRPGRRSGRSNVEAVTFDMYARAWQSHFPHLSINGNVTGKAYQVFSLIYGEDTARIIKSYKRRHPR